MLNLTPNVNSAKIASARKGAGVERLTDKKIMATVVLLVGCGVVLCALLVAKVLYGRTQSVDVALGDTHLKALVADTSAERTQGLSGSKPLKQNEGMLFVFEADDRHAIWMKDMGYPLDVVWLDSGKKIIHIEKHLSPDSYPQTFAPDSPARYVIEIPSGFADAHQVREGNTAIFSR